MELQFRIEKDPRIITKLNKTVHQKHVAAQGAIFRAYNYEEFLEWFTEELSKENVFSVVIALEGKDIGYALIIHKTVSPTNPFHQPDYASFHIDQMSVNEEYQGKGIGSQLFEFIKELSRAKGVNRIQLSVWADNEQAKAFYTKLGFEKMMLLMEYKLDENQ